MYDHRGLAPFLFVLQGAQAIGLAARNHHLPIALNDLDFTVFDQAVCPVPAVAEHVGELRE